MLDFEYKIVNSHKGTEDLAYAINEEIKQGWFPQGGMCSTVVNGDLVVSQAVIRSNDVMMLDDTQGKLGMVPSDIILVGGLC